MRQVGFEYAKASGGAEASSGTGGKAAGGQLVDQRFCPRIVEGELRYNCVGPKLVGIIHKKPTEGGISAVSGTGSIYTFYGPEEPKFANLTTNFLTKDIDKVMPALCPVSNGRGFRDWLPAKCRLP